MTRKEFIELLVKKFRFSIDAEDLVRAKWPTAAENMRQGKDISKLDQIVYIYPDGACIHVWIEKNGKHNTATVYYTTPEEEFSTYSASIILDNKPFDEIIDYFEAV